MEQGGSKGDANVVAAAKAKLERDTTAKDPEEETKRAMEIAGAPSLRRRWRAPSRCGFPRL